MQLISFKMTCEIPYYYPCYFPLIHDKLIAKSSLSYLSLLASDQLYSIPAYRFDRTTSVSTVAWYSPLLKLEPKIYTMERKFYRSLEEGLYGIHEHLSQNDFFISLGTTYYLPYSRDYKNPKYIESHVKSNSNKYVTDHYLSVYGLHNENIFINDPVPNKYIGAISLKDFSDFWKGNKGIPELASAEGVEKLVSYSTLDVMIKETLNENNIIEKFLTVLHTVSDEFLKGKIVSKESKTYYFGNSATKMLKDNINEAIEKSNNLISMYNKCIFDLRWSRYFLNDLINDINMILGNRFLIINNELQDIIKLLEDLYKLLLLNISKPTSKKEFLKKLNEKMTNIYQKEINLHEKILFSIKSMRN